MVNKKTLIALSDALHVVNDVRNFLPVQLHDMSLVLTISEMLKDLPSVDAVELVRCKDCQHGIFDEEKGVWKCVESAEWDEGMGDWFGFVVYHPSDFYCANGERRHNEN